jgi:hypothetical protein
LIVIVCILWFGGHSVVGDHVTFPSLHATLPVVAACDAVSDASTVHMAASTASFLNGDPSSKC